MDEYGSSVSALALFFCFILLAVVARTGSADSLDPAIRITLSTRLGALSAIPAAGATQSARLALIRGGSVTDATVDALDVTSGTLPLVGQWLETGDEILFESLTDGSGAAAASALLGDTTVTLANLSATVTYEITMSLSAMLATNATGNDATVDVRTQLTNEDSGALLTPVVGAASDSFFGPPLENIDDTQQFSVQIPPLGQVRLLLEVDVQGAVNQLGNAGATDGYHGENQTRLSLVSAQVVSAPPAGPPPVGAAPVPTLSSGTWLLLVLVVALVAIGGLGQRKGAEA